MILERGAVQEGEEIQEFQLPIRESSHMVEGRPSHCY